MSGALGRFRRGAFQGLLANVIGGVDQFLLVPLFLSAWSPQLYGEWLTLFAAAAYVVFCDLGLSTFVVNRLNQEYSRDERSAFLATLHSALAFSAVVCAGLLGAALLVATVLPFERWLGLQHLEHARPLVVLIALQFVVSLPRGIDLGVYRAVGEYDRGALLSNVRRVVTVATTATLLLLGGSPVFVALGVLVPVFLVLAFALVDLRRRHAWMRFGVAARVPGLARSFLRPSVLFLGVQVSLVLLTQGSTLVVGALFGAGAVAAFVTTRTLANLIRQGTGTLSNALWPELTRLAARRRSETLHTVHGLFVKGLTALALAGALFLHHAGPPLYAAWTRGALALDPVLLDAFLLLAVVQTPWTSSATVLLATNRHQELARRQLASACASLALGTCLAGWLGPRGLVLGVLCVELAFCAVQVPRNAMAVTGGSLHRYLGEVYGRGALVAATALLLLRLADPLGELALVPGLGVTALAAASAVGLSAWSLWLTPFERAHVSALLRGTRIPRPLGPQRGTS